MIVLDTNVISEMMRPQPHPGVVAWVSAQPRNELYTTSINRAEILYGIAAMPEGRRRVEIAGLVESMFTEDFADRILPFDAEAAPFYARIVATRRQAGAPIDGFDALIAAVALRFDAQIATRDVGGFEGCGLAIIEPWRG
jgi:predicted nucleic acid-binding protein